MENIDKTPLELSIDIKTKNSETIRMQKVIYTGFIPQHGMEIMDTELFFRVRTTALAGLQTLKHTAVPLRRGKFIEGSRKVVSKLFPKDDALLREALEFFSKNGWTIER